MWDYSGSHDDGDDDIPLEVLRDNVEDMLDNTIHHVDQSSEYVIG